ncbi:DUF3140 domain-containing protein [Rhodopirellula sp. SWK7]|uniref:DUF3140 domain-containing protein n=1 Tax=Rhodopirellula sp. SWK7 TaxID=595460 RepID=UPI0002BDC2B9|nr:DUF3140 domain-containing protein [Rhodopirellula sp. SWK7]EMI43431.1 DNA-binding protein [Rhodopirellula sp. SWK7]
MSSTLSAENEQTYQDFYDLVNMQPKEIEDWLETEQSQSVGHTRDGEDESVGHQSGAKIIEIKRTKKSDLTEDQIAHMRKVCGYIKRHTAQRPGGDVADTDWCYSLKNWGHDPTR